MKIEITQRKRTTVRLGDLRYGDGFLSLEGTPYIVLDPNKTCFKIQTISELKVPVLALCERTEAAVLGLLDGETKVRLADVKITLTERN